ncbi:MAG: cupin domain-containing protein [Actinobacteria bacterium]|nr:cupin domain-containing protein [Actinomycetota bacterium]
MDGVVLRPGEGESLFDGRIVIKADFEQLCITESHFDSARDGASPHFHRQHADSFYVLEGGLAVLVVDDEKLLSPAACACAPPEVVHGFRSTSPARFLNFHTPNAGFAGNLRARDRGEPRGFDSVDAPAGSGPPGTDAVFLGPKEGERLEGNMRIATIKVGREELALIEFELEPGFNGPDPHTHDDQVDSFYVLDGEPEFFVSGETLRLGPGSYVAAPTGVVHTFSNPGPDRARLLNIHAPSCGFHEWLRKQS